MQKIIKQILTVMVEGFIFMIASLILFTVSLGLLGQGYVLAWTDLLFWVQMFTVGLTCVLVNYIGKLLKGVGGNY